MFNAKLFVLESKIVNFLRGKKPAQSEQWLKFYIDEQNRNSKLESELKGLKTKFEEADACTIDLMRGILSEEGFTEKDKEVFREYLNKRNVSLKYETETTK